MHFTGTLFQFYPRSTGKEEGKKVLLGTVAFNSIQDQLVHNDTESEFDVLAFNSIQDQLRRRYLPFPSLPLGFQFYPRSTSLSLNGNKMKTQ